jgi:5-methylcytosine-specific restriction endonuclease McrA
METITKHKRGDVREDGMMFWQRFKNKEMWVTKEKFEFKKQSHVNSEKKYRNVNKDLISIKRKENRIKNGDHIRKRERLWWSSNPEKTKILRKRKYDNQSPEKRSQIMRVVFANRRARKLNQTPNLNEDQKKIIKCFYDQAYRLEKRFGLKFHVDHIIPIARGGLHEPKNLQVIPKKINQQKNAHKIFIWAKL